MKKLIVLSVVGAVALALQAAPGAKPDPVAAGYPAWTGLTEQNWLFGRRLEPSDLRQRVAIVYEFDSAKAHEQLMLGAGVASSYNRLAIGAGENWEHRNVHHDTIVIFINRGAKMTEEKMKEAMSGTELKEQQAIQPLRESFVSIYQGDVTFPGAPDAGGEYPFYYVMGHEGTEPLAKGKAPNTGAALLAAVRPAVEKGRKAMQSANLEWKPFYGLVAEPKYFAKDIKVPLSKGKPLVSCEAKLKKAVTSSDAEKAKEAQMLYDGLVQTRSDFAMRIGLEARQCPHRAAYDAMMLQKYWSGLGKLPGGKKDKGGKSKGGGDVGALSQVFIKMMEYSDPNFTCKNAGEAKKVVAELNKHKKTLARLKESSNLTVQNGALVLEMEIDELISLIPTKVPSK